MRRVVVLGGEGQLARSIAYVAQSSHNEYVMLSRSDADLCDITSLERAVECADVVVNCAAYTNVEAAEDDYDGALRVNALGVKNLAQICLSRSLPLIHISTDYVFGGDAERTTPYLESDAVAPINGYGRSKAEGERALLDSGCGVVIRTSWLYSPWCKNFCRTILSHSAERNVLSVVDDQRGVPTSALSLARFIVRIIDEELIPSMRGIYHFTDLGDATWCDFARAIVQLSGHDCRVDACTTQERAMRAPRPSYSVLGSERLSETNTTLTPWRDALREVIDIIERNQ